MPVPGRKITIQLDPDDPNCTVELSLVEELTTKEGSGPTFRRRITTFNNDPNVDALSRTVAVRQVTHRKRLPTDDEDDPSQTLKCEVILNATTAEQSGRLFTRRIYTFNPDDANNHRTRHDKRIKNKDNPDIWIDVRRKDQFITLEGSGKTFMRRLTSVLWNDASDDNEFDKNTLIAEPIPVDPKKPIRLDFLQDIVNINKGGPFLILDFEIDWENGDDNSLASATFATPAAPRADPPLRAYGPPDDNTILLGGFFQKVVTDPTLKSDGRITTKMRKELAFFSLPLISGFGTEVYLIGTKVKDSDPERFVNFSGTPVELTAYLKTLTDGGLKITSNVQITGVDSQFSQLVPSVTHVEPDLDGDEITLLDSAGHGYIKNAIAINLSRWLPKRAQGDPAFTGSIVFTVHIPQTFVQKQHWIGVTQAFDFNHPVILGPPPVYPASEPTVGAFATPKEWIAIFNQFLADTQASGLTITEIRDNKQLSYFPQTLQTWKLKAATYARSNYPYDKTLSAKWDTSTTSGSAQKTGTGGNVEPNWHVAANTPTTEGPNDPGFDLKITVTFPSLRVSIGT